MSNRQVHVTLPSGETLLAGTEDIESSIQFHKPFDDTQIIVISSMYKSDKARPYTIIEPTKCGFKALSYSDPEVRFSWMALGRMALGSLVEPPIYEGIGIFADRYSKTDWIQEVRFGPGRSYIIPPDPIVIVTPGGEFSSPSQHNDTVRNVVKTMFYVSSKNKTNYIHWIAIGLVDKGAEGRPIKMTFSPGGETLLAGSQIKKTNHLDIPFHPGESRSIFERAPIVVITPRVTDNTLPNDEGIPNTDAITAVNGYGFSIDGTSLSHTINWIALGK